MVSLLTHICVTRPQWVMRMRVPWCLLHNITQSVFYENNVIITHYSYIIWAPWRHKTCVTRLFVQQLINIHVISPVLKESTSESIGWFPTQRAVNGAMTSSWKSSMLRVNISGVTPTKFPGSPVAIYIRVWGSSKSWSQRYQNIGSQRPLTRKWQNMCLWTNTNNKNNLCDDT